jgi:hypothetical protein
VLRKPVLIELVKRFVRVIRPVLSEEKRPALAITWLAV